MNVEEFFVACAPISREVRERAVKLAATDEPILIVGPEGSGRRRLAQLIHLLSARQDRPYVTLDCPAHTEGAWPTRLYGTGSDAAGASPGILDRAAEGTLTFVGLDAAPSTLVNALRDLLDGRPLTRRDADLDAAPLVLHARILATAVPGEAVVALRTLFSRVLQLPPLAQRSEDIPDLVRSLLSQLSLEFGTSLAPPDIDLMQRLSRLSWDNGEVQQLRRALRFAVRGASDGVFREELLPDWVLSDLAAPVAVSPAAAARVAVTQILPVGSPSDRLAAMVREVTTGLLDLDQPLAPPAFALRCKRADFETPIIREVIRGTLDACYDHLARNLRDIRAGSRPILRFLPTTEGAAQASAEDLAEHFRVNLEQRIQLLRKLPEDVNEDEVVEIIAVEPDTNQRRSATLPEVQESYDRLVEIFMGTGKDLPSRKQMVEILERELLKKVQPTYVTEARKSRGHDRSGARRGKPGEKVGIDIALEEEGEERFKRESRAGTDVQSRSDRALDRATELSRMDGPERCLAARKVGISLDGVDDPQDQVRLLTAAEKIRDFIASNNIRHLAGDLEIKSSGATVAELRKQVFNHLWQQHLHSESTKESPSDGE